MDIEDLIKEKYPQLVSQHMVSCNCGEGWHPIILNVCEQIKHYGVSIAQIKEKFGTLRIYLYTYSNGRIILDEIIGLKDGKEVDYNNPNVEVMIRFFDNKIFNNEDDDNDDKYRFYYNPRIDKFYDYNMNEVDLDEENKKFIKGRLAELTGLVDADPIKERPAEDIIDEAEIESSKTCEDCGSKEGVTSEGSWIRTLCANCRNVQYDNAGY